MPGKCAYFEIDSFGRDMAMLSCCKSPDAFGQIVDYHQMMIDQKIPPPYSELVQQMMRGEHKVNGHRVIAIPGPNPDFYCKSCDFYQ